MIEWVDNSEIPKKFKTKNNNNVIHPENEDIYTNTFSLKMECVIII